MVKFCVLLTQCRVLSTQSISFFLFFFRFGVVFYLLFVEVEVLADQFNAVLVTK